MTDPQAKAMRMALQLATELRRLHEENEALRQVLDKPEIDTQALVEIAVLAEREACAKLCDEKTEAEYATGKVDHNEMAWTQACAMAIRARGQA